MVACDPAAACFTNPCFYLLDEGKVLTPFNSFVLAAGIGRNHFAAAVSELVLNGKFPQLCPYSLLRQEWIEINL